MMQLFKQNLFFFLIAFALSGKLSAQPEVLSPNTRVSVITCGQGDELYSLFWHTALRFYDPEQQLDVVLNYGTFDFDTPNFYMKFVKGDLQYCLSVDRYDRFVSNYRADQRSIDEQFLNLSDEQKQKIWSEVLRQLQTEDRFYTYKFIDNNCTTKVVDLLNSVLEAPLPVEFAENKGTYRSILNTYLDRHYFEKLGINLIFGSKTDRQNHHIFLPDKLWSSLQKAENGAQPLLDENIKVNEVPFSAKPLFLNSYAFFLLICIALSFTMKYQGARNTWFVLLGIMGLFFILVGGYSLHKEVLMNYVVLFCNPIYLLYLLIRKEKLKKVFYILITVFLLLYFITAGWEKICIFSPLLWVTVTAWVLEYRFHFWKQ